MRYFIILALVLASPLWGQSPYPSTRAICTMRHLTHLAGTSETQTRPETHREARCEATSLPEHISRAYTRRAIQWVPLTPHILLHRDISPTLPVFYLERMGKFFRVRGFFSEQPPPISIHQFKAHLQEEQER